MKPNSQPVILSFMAKLPYSQLVMLRKHLQQKCLQQRCLHQRYFWQKYQTYTNIPHVLHSPTSPCFPRTLSHTTCYSLKGNPKMRLLRKPRFKLFFFSQTSCINASHFLRFSEIHCFHLLQSEY